MPLPLIGAESKKIADKDSPHHINIAFLDDHSFDGTRVDVQNVSPEQIGAVILHLQHISMMLIGARQQQIAAAMAQEQAIRQELAKGN